MGRPGRGSEARRPAAGEAEPGDEARPEAGGLASVDVKLRHIATGIDLVCLGVVLDGIGKHSFRNRGRAIPRAKLGPQRAEVGPNLRDWAHGGPGPIRATQRLVSAPDTRHRAGDRRGRGLAGLRRQEAHRPLGAPGLLEAGGACVRLWVQLC